MKASFLSIKVTEEALSAVYVNLSRSVDRYIHFLHQLLPLYAHQEYWMLANPTDFSWTASFLYKQLVA